LKLSTSPGFRLALCTLRLSSRSRLLGVASFQHCLQSVLLTSMWRCAGALLLTIRHSIATSACGSGCTRPGAR
jgi:hypothetical protein